MLFRSLAPRRRRRCLGGVARRRWADLAARAGVPPELARSVRRGGSRRDRGRGGRDRGWGRDPRAQVFPGRDGRVGRGAPLIGGKDVQINNLYIGFRILLPYIYIYVYIYSTGCLLIISSVDSSFPILSSFAPPLSHALHEGRMSFYDTYNSYQNYSDRKSVV